MVLLVVFLLILNVNVYSSLDVSLVALNKQYSLLYNNLPQIMPIPSVFEEAVKTSVQHAFKQQKKFFEEDCKKYAYLNARIPYHTKGDGIVRIVTYNSNYQKSSPSGLSLDIKNVLKALNADILIVQEVPIKQTTTSPKQLGSEIKTLFAEFGYTHAAVMRAHEDFANVILSKPELFAKASGVVFSDQGQTGSKKPTQRSYVRVDYMQNNKPWLTVFGTHLELRDEEIRTKQLMQIVQAANTAGTENVLIAGDFNALRKKDYDYAIDATTGWDILVKRFQSFKNSPPVSTKALDFLAKTYIDCFEKASLPGPKFTAENGQVLDHIFLNKNWNIPIKGCYVYYSDASDHLPVIMDINHSF